MAKIVPIVLCGGEGKRLRPLSTPQTPKPFLSLLGKESLLQQTVKRLTHLKYFTPSLLVGHQDHVDLIQRHLKEIESPFNAIVAEPEGKGTAAAVIMASLLFLSKIQSDKNTLMLVCPSDHAVKDLDAWSKAIEDAVPVALKGNLVLFGAPAENVDNGYGYILAGDAHCKKTFKVNRFEEKPDVTDVSELDKEGQIFWNTGMILVSPSLLLEKVKKYALPLYKKVARACAEGDWDREVFSPDAKHWSKLTEAAIDTVLLEKMQSSVLMPILAGWSDVGTWERLEPLQASYGIFMEKKLVHI